jgi:hypothetical protein
VSEDRTVDLFPLLRPCQSRKQLDDYVRAFTAASVHDYHASMNWLDSRRFYLSAQQCTDINAAIARLKALPMEVGEIRFLPSLFSSDPDFDASYLID